MGHQILVIVGLTLVNAFFSGAEIAILAVRPTRLRELAAQGHAGASVALRLRGDPERFLATVQVGITVVGATAGAFGGAVLEHPIAARLAQLGVGDASEQIAFALVVAFVSILSVVVGELVPKSLALRHAERGALWVSRPLFFISRVARPLIWLLAGASNVLLRPFRDQTTFTEARLSPEELQQLVAEATTAGAVDRETGEIASRAIDLGRLKAFSVMVPRREVTWLPLHASRETLQRILRETPHARYPVLDTAQQPLGYVLTHEVYAGLLAGELDLAKLLREIPLFPEQAPAVEILRALQRARTEIGIVVDETGFPSGLVSIETLAEELFGEIAAERENPRPSIEPSGRGRFDIRGDTPLHEVNRELGLDLPINHTASTLAGLILAAHGGFPPGGTRLELAEGVHAEVLETSARRVVRVRLTMQWSRE
ncbi:MAG: hemolysin family protein [Polyangiaceae bacterium]